MENFEGLFEGETFCLERDDARITYPVASNIHNNISSINNLAKALLNFYDVNDEFVLACRGSSGAIIGAMVAVQFPNSTLVHVKKEGESSHGSSVTFFNAGLPVVFVDDFMDSGQTVIDTLRTINDYSLEYKNVKFSTILTLTNHQRIQDMFYGYHGPYILDILTEAKHITYFKL